MDPLRLSNVAGERAGWDLIDPPSPSNVVATYDWRATDHRFTPVQFLWCECRWWERCGSADCPDHFEKGMFLFWGEEGFKWTGLGFVVQRVLSEEKGIHPGVRIDRGLHFKWSGYALFVAFSTVNCVVPNFG